jgi:hypothetical protein
MRGVTLLEFLAGLALFLVLLFFSYHAFDMQTRLIKNISARTEPEQESNYRLLLIKHFLERSSLRLRGDPFLERAPIFFQDLSFGKSAQSNSFSIARVIGLVLPFVRSGFHYKLQPGAALNQDKTYLVAGSDSGGDFSWNYTRLDQVLPSAQQTLVRMEPFTMNPEVQRGNLIEVEIHGFVFQNQTLYWISPGGAYQPYFSPLDSFEYDWHEPNLSVRWKTGLIQMEFRCAL